MVDGNAIAAIGAAAGAGAVAAGVKAVRAHIDLAWHEGVGAAIQRLFEETVSEPVPDDMIETLRELPEDTQ